MGRPLSLKVLMLLMLVLVIGIEVIFSFLIFSTQSNIQTLRMAQLLGSTVQLCLLVYFFLLFRKFIHGSYHKVAQYLESLSTGDFTRILNHDDAQQAGELGEHYNKLSTNIRDVLAKFGRESVATARIAKILDEQSKRMSTSIDEVVSQLHASATASEELASSAVEISHNCSVASDSSQKAREVAGHGKQVAEAAKKAMDQVADVVAESATITQKLDKRSDEIGSITEMIRSIADQTNMLALNAAIEAARAGEHGRGFAVVSDEVRKLAAETSEAVAQINETVTSMRNELVMAVKSMEQTVSLVNVGSEEIKKSGIALEEIATSVESVVAEIQHIENASKEQTSTTDALSGNIHRVTDLMTDEAKNINSNSAAIERMERMARDMKQMIGRFRLVTPDDAKAMVQKAYQYIKTHGREKAFAEFNNPEGEFIQGELFILAQEFDGLMLAYGGEAPLVGKNLKNACDADGKLLAPPLIEIARTKGEGWHQYRYMNPHTDRVEPKLTYIKALENNAYIACGIFQPQGYKYESVLHS
ncbi:methyl-accepting chemotaxis protein [Gynuella sunshinyii]|nr:methyl-accepting chemotaxis protein [Gynuella sunshinyii]